MESRGRESGYRGGAEEDEMKKPLIVAVLIYPTLAAHAQTPSWFQKANFGEGKKSCREWSKDNNNSAARS